MCVCTVPPSAHGMTPSSSSSSSSLRVQAIATLDLMTRFPQVPPATLYTFGEPRVGDFDFAQPLIDTNRTFRVVHHHDIVPHVAPCCHPNCSPTSTCPHHHGIEVS